jgi:hypothetical protein
MEEETFENDFSEEDYSDDMEEAPDYESYPQEEEDDEVY